MEYRVYPVNEKGAGWMMVNVNPCGEFGVSEPISARDAESLRGKILADGMGGCVHIVKNWIK